MANTIAVKAKSTDKKKSADYRHTLSWLTTSHNSLWGNLRIKAQFSQ